MDDDEIFRPAGLGGEGWWDHAVKETKRVAKKVQKSSVVRGLEKRAVKAGADVLRGAATAATDGLACRQRADLAGRAGALAAGRPADKQGRKVFGEKGCGLSRPEDRRVR